MLVIFDCDGVLVDSELISAQALSECLCEAGFTISAAECLTRFKGWTATQSYAWLELTFNRPLPSNFNAGLVAHTKSLLKDRLQPTAGVDMVLENLRRRAIPYCLASNGPHEKIAWSMNVTGLDHYFPDSICFSSEDVNEGKPSPELFRHAAEHIGVPARFCWVIEDSFSGCVAASRAGMRFVYFNHEACVPDDIIQLSPTAVYDTMIDVNNFLNSLHRV